RRGQLGELHDGPPVAHRPARSEAALEVGDRQLRAGRSRRTVEVELAPAKLEPVRWRPVGVEGAFRLRRWPPIEEEHLELLWIPFRARVGIAVDGLPQLGGGAKDDGGLHPEPLLDRALELGRDRIRVAAPGPEDD